MKNVLAVWQRPKDRRHLEAAEETDAVSGMTRKGSAGLQPLSAKPAMRWGHGRNVWGMQRANLPDMEISEKHQMRKWAVGMKSQFTGKGNTDGFGAPEKNAHSYQKKCKLSLHGCTVFFFGGGGYRRIKNKKVTSKTA